MPSGGAARDNLRPKIHKGLGLASLPSRAGLSRAAEEPTSPPPQGAPSRYVSTARAACAGDHVGPA
jgi:hypothetical protein